MSGHLILPRSRRAGLVLGVEGTDGALFPALCIVRRGRKACQFLAACRLAISRPKSVTARASALCNGPNSLRGGLIVSQISGGRSARQRGRKASGPPYDSADSCPPGSCDPFSEPDSRTTNEPIPGYKLVKRIGAGGYGEVWTAEAPGELVKAIKFVYGLLDEDRAARELKALNRIKGVRHPFLLSLERIEVVEGQLLIVTELADCSLKDRFEECRKKRASRASPATSCSAIMRDAADALDYMSEQHSLQHLDVKPENLLLLGGRIKVADFGLVKDIHDHTASMMGGLTPIYAPPEVFEGRPSRRSDQYSLAIVYQEMLTGVLPFPGPHGRAARRPAPERQAAADVAAGERPGGDRQGAVEEARRALRQLPRAGRCAGRGRATRPAAAGRVASAATARTDRRRRTR